MTLHSIIPATEPATFYFVSYDYPPSNGFGRACGFHDLDNERNTRTQIIRDIAEGQYENVDRVYVGRVGEGFEDVSEEIAVEVLQYILSEFDSEPRSSRDFLENHLGVFAVERALIEAGLLEVA